MRNFWLSLIVLVTLTVAGSGDVHAGAHYLVGAGGSGTGEIPPPGFYYKMYNVYYRATKFKDGSKSLPGRTKTESFTQLHRFIWNTGHKVLGGDLIFDTYIPLSYTKLSGDLAGTTGDKDKFGVGDVFFETLLQWRVNDKLSILVAPAVVLPVGNYHKDNPASPGLGYFSFMANAGGSYYFDDEKKWNINGMFRYETSTTEFKTHKRSGDYLHFEASLTRRFDKWAAAFIMAGSWQTTSGQGMGKDNRKRNYLQTVGPEISYSPTPTTEFQVKALFEFKNRNQPQGTLYSLTFMKAF